MKYSILLALVLMPFAALAINHNYDPNRTPYNLDQAIEYGPCEDDVDEFHTAYWDPHADLLCLLDGSCGGGGLRSAYEVQLDAAYQSFETIDLNYEVKFAECLSKIDKAAEEAEDEARRERQRERREQREAAISVALKECDFEFFETMSQSQKMASYDERQACEEQRASDPAPDEPITLPAVVVPVAAPVPTYTPPVERAIRPELVKTVEPAIIAETEATSTPATTTATSTEPETIEVTEEELNRLVEEQVAQALAEKQPDPEKPSVITRVVNFLFGWMW